MQEIKNEEIILMNVLKWLFLSVVAGALTGGLIAGFLILLQTCIRYVSDLPDWRYALIPAGLLASIYSVRLISPSAEGHGTDKVISAIYTEESDNQARMNNACSLSNYRQDVLEATANLYLARQVILEHA